MIFEKLFKKEELQGDCVKYSKATAKNNPRMISREYERLISNIKEEIEDINEKIINGSFSIDIKISNKENKFAPYIKEEVFVNSWGYVDREMFKSILVIPEKSKERKAILKIHPETLKDILDNYKQERSFIEEKEEKIKKINKEHSVFIHKYGGETLVKGRN